MTILVTGGAGFIGANFVIDWLAHSDETVINLDKLTYAGSLENLASLKDNKHHHFVQGDICDADLVVQLIEKHQPRAIVHFAAESHVDRSISGPEAFVQTNIVGTFRLLEAAKNHWHSLQGEEKSAFRFLHVSTDEVYGTLGLDDPAFSETNPHEPNSPYSASKAASDHMVRAYFHTYGLPVLTSNCSNNYGPLQFPEKLIPLVMQRALSGQDIPIYGDGKQIRDWLYVLDHCEAIRTVLASGKMGETYNIGGNSEKTNLEVVNTLCEKLDQISPKTDGSSYKQQITFVADRPGHDRRYAINAEKIRTQLGWQAKQTFEKGIEKTINWYLDNSAWLSSILNRTNEKTILLLGANGQLGRALKTKLAALGKVISYDRQQMDLQNHNALRALIQTSKPSYIVNAAAYTAVDKAEQQQDLAKAVNVDAVAVLAEEAKNINAILVHYSTDYVFDGKKPGPYIESDKASPMNVYGATKLAGERAIEASGCKHLIFRTSWVYSENGHNFVKTVLRIADEHEELKMVADQVGAPTSADLIASVTCQALKTLMSSGNPGEYLGSYNLVAAGNTNWCEFAKYILEVAAKDKCVLSVSSSDFKSAAARPKNSCLDTTKLKNKFGITLPAWQRDVKTIVQTLVNEVVDA